MTNKAELTPEEQSEKTESCREDSWDGNTVERAIRQIQTQEQNKKSSGQARLVYAAEAELIYLGHSHRSGWPRTELQKRSSGIWGTGAIGQVHTYSKGRAHNQVSRAQRQSDWPKTKLR